VTAHLVGDVEIIDVEAYAEYRRRFDRILAQFGGSILVAGGVPESLE
jgi:uncharacterized protein (DUF1330 family)